MTGKVTRFSSFNGWGFISGDDQKTYFAHQSKIVMDGFRTLYKGQKVSFEAYQSENGYHAIHIKVISDNHAELKQTMKYKIKKNPFTPQDPVTDPSKFFGREDSFINCIDAIINNKNVLITGPKGIGKSSLSYQLLYMTEGESRLLDEYAVDLDGMKFNRVTGNYRCLPNSSINEIISSLLFTLSCESGLTCKTEKTQNIEVDAKLIKYSQETKRIDLSVSELATYFTTEVYRIYKNVENRYNGICFLLDEIDVLDEEVMIAPFLKSVIEKFRFDGFSNICFIVSGITGTITTLVSQHSSAQRLFEQLELSILTNDDLRSLMISSLDSVSTKIDPNVLNSIIDIANGFPQPVHLIGYHCFRIDTDSFIAQDDYLAAVQFVILNIKKQEFQVRVDKLGRGIGFDILKTLALSDSDFVDTQVVYAQLGNVDNSSFYGVIGNLNKDNYIEINSRQGLGFKDPLLKRYIRIINNYSGL